MIAIYRDPHSFTGQKEKKNIIEYNFTKNRSISYNEACVIGALVSGMIYWEGGRYAV
jgi:hypothetical protein